MAMGGTNNMTKVIVATNYRSRFWNIGDTVELFGDELRVQLEAGNVELADGEPQPAIVCELCGKEAKSEFGLMAHMKTHKGGDK